MSVTQERMSDELNGQKGGGSLAWLWIVMMAAATGFLLYRYGGAMDVYEQGILIGAGMGIAVMGWHWAPIRILIGAVGLLSIFALDRYAGVLGAAETDFFLKFLISSQSAIMWMSALFVLATVTYFIALPLRSEFIARVATSMTWSAVTMGLVGLMVRWYESYLIGSDIGHIPVSNLYEVFILFCIITSMIYLHYEAKFQTRALGGFVLLVVSAGVGFILWYTFDREAHHIAPLVPALQSYWMKIHVPANFVGYGAFAMAAMIGVAYLIKDKFGSGEGGVLPSNEVLDLFMYRSIALGFAFFTIATVLGAMWAAEAWGGYWSWDPKETWALIVWLNYAAWLHMRLTKGWRGTAMAWWAVIGLFVTLFAFLGVNMFLSGLHSYGEL